MKIIKKIINLILYLVTAFEKVAQWTRTYFIKRGLLSICIFPI